MGSHDGAKEHFTTRIFGAFADLSSAEELKFCAPTKCKLSYVVVTMEAAITVADATVEVKNLADEVLATVVMPFTDAAAGDSVRVDVLTDVELEAGDFLSIETDGGSTTVSPGPFVIGLLRD